MGLFSDAMNPHKKHGVLGANYVNDFWVALEMDYDKIKEKSDVSALRAIGSMFDIQQILTDICRYRILWEAVYTSFDGTKTVGQQLERAIEAAEYRSHCRSLPYCEEQKYAVAAELLRSAYEQAADELRSTYGDAVNRPLTRRS